MYWIKVQYFCSTQLIHENDWHLKTMYVKLVFETVFILQLSQLLWNWSKMVQSPNCNGGRSGTNNGPFQKCNVILGTSLFWLALIGQDVIYEDAEIVQYNLRGRKLNFWIGPLPHIVLFLLLLHIIRYDSHLVHNKLICISNS